MERCHALVMGTLDALAIAHNNADAHRRGYPDKFIGATLPPKDRSSTGDFEGDRSLQRTGVILSAVRN